MQQHWQFLHCSPGSMLHAHHVQSRLSYANTGMGQRDGATCDLILAGGCPCSACRSAMALLCNVRFSHNAAVQCTRRSARRMHGVAIATYRATGHFGRLCCSSCSACRQPTVLAALVSGAAALVSGAATRCGTRPSASSPFCGLVTSAFGQAPKFVMEHIRWLRLLQAWGLGYSSKMCDTCIRWLRGCPAEGLRGCTAVAASCEERVCELTITAELPSVPSCRAYFSCSS